MYGLYSELSTVLAAQHILRQTREGEELSHVRKPGQGRAVSEVNRHTGPCLAILMGMVLKASLCGGSARLSPTWQAWETKGTGKWQVRPLAFFLIVNVKMHLTWKKTASSHVTSQLYPSTGEYIRK